MISGFSESIITIGKLGADSARNCRQAPQGETPLRLTTATREVAFARRAFGKDGQAE